MRRKRSASPYRIVGARGEWFAWSRHGRLQGWLPHVARITVPVRGDGYVRDHLEDVTAVFGRTPFEALERLKRIEARPC